MRKYRRPFYRRPWLWVVVIVLLIGSGWFIANQNQNERVEKDAVVMKAPKKAKHDKKSKQQSKKETKQQTNSSSQFQQQSYSSTQSQPQSGQQSTSGNYANRSDPQVTMPNTESSTLEPWVDPDNYEPNSIIGDRSTMHCYLPGQNPYPEIAPENIVYFNSLAEAQAAGYSTVQ